MATSHDILTRVMHQPINAVVTNFIAARRDSETSEDVKVVPADIELPDNGNNKVIVSDDTKLEEMAQMSCNIETKVISILIYI